MMTREERKTIRDECDNVTAGPWAVECTGDEAFIGTYSGRLSHPYDGHLPILDENLVSRTRTWPHNRGRGEKGATLQDLEFMASSRSTIPALLDDADEREAEIEKLRAEIVQLTQERLK